MRTLTLLFIVLLMHTGFCQQVTSTEITFDFNIAYCSNGEKPATAWEGNNIVVILESEKPSDRNATVMTQVINTFENVINHFQETTGLYNLPIASSYKGKPVIEVLIDNCGAGGLANHGRIGMSTGTSLFDQFYNLVDQGTIAIPQVFLYELNRNFWLPSFNDKFDWAMNNEPQNWGWWTVGMNNAQAYMIPKSLGIQVHYFGTTGLEFWADRMEANLTSYMEGSQYSFDNGWRQSLMPWNDRESINDLMSGLIIYSYKNFGGDEWLKGFYEHIRNNDISDRPDVFSYQECRDNVYRVWSYAAKSDLLNFFENDLKWKISQNAKEDVETFLEDNLLSIPEVGGLSGVKVYPNPAVDKIIIETSQHQNQSLNIDVYNSLGQLVHTFKQTNQNKIELDVKGFDQGLYWLKMERKTYPVVIR